MLLGAAFARRRVVGLIRRTPELLEQLGERLLLGARELAVERLAAQLRAAGAARVAESPVQALARAIAPSPAAVDEAAVHAARDLPPAAIVEVVTFIALLQLLHRLESYYTSEG